LGGKKRSFRKQAKGTIKKNHAGLPQEKEQTERESELKGKHFLGQKKKGHGEWGPEGEPNGEKTDD